MTCRRAHNGNVLAAIAVAVLQLALQPVVFGATEPWLSGHDVCGHISAAECERRLELKELIESFSVRSFNENRSVHVAFGSWASGLSPGVTTVDVQRAAEIEANQGTTLADFELAPDHEYSVTSCGRRYPVIDGIDHNGADYAAPNFIRTTGNPHVVSWVFTVGDSVATTDRIALYSPTMHVADIWLGEASNDGDTSDHSILEVLWAPRALYYEIQPVDFAEQTMRICADVDFGVAGEVSVTSTTALMHHLLSAPPPPLVDAVSGMMTMATTIEQNHHDTADLLRFLTEFHATSHTGEKLKFVFGHWAHGLVPHVPGLEVVSSTDSTDVMREPYHGCNTTENEEIFTFTDAPLDVYFAGDKVSLPVKLGDQLIAQDRFSLYFDCFHVVDIVVIERGNDNDQSRDLESDVANRDNDDNGLVVSNDDNDARADEEQALASSLLISWPLIRRPPFPVSTSQVLILEMFIADETYGSDGMQPLRVHVNVDYPPEHPQDAKHWKGTPETQQPPISAQDVVASRPPREAYTDEEVMAMQSGNTVAEGDVYATHNCMYVQWMEVVEACQAVFEPNGCSPMEIAALKRGQLFFVFFTYNCESDFKIHRNVARVSSIPGCETGSGQLLSCYKRWGEDARSNMLAPGQCERCDMQRSVLSSVAVVLPDASARLHRDVIPNTHPPGSVEHQRALTSLFVNSTKQQQQQQQQQQQPMVLDLSPSLSACNDGPGHRVRCNWGRLRSRLCSDFEPKLWLDISVFHNDQIVTTKALCTTESALSDEHNRAAYDKVYSCPDVHMQTLNAGMEFEALSSLSVMATTTNGVVALGTVPIASDCEQTPTSPTTLDDHQGRNDGDDGDDRIFAVGSFDWNDHSRSSFDQPDESWNLTPSLMTWLAQSSNTLSKQRMINDESDPRVVYVVLVHGIGNRLVHIASAIALGIATNRALLVRNPVADAWHYNMWDSPFPTYNAENAGAYTGFIDPLDMMHQKEPRLGSLYSSMFRKPHCDYGLCHPNGGDCFSGVCRDVIHKVDRCQALFEYYDPEEVFSDSMIIFDRICPLVRDLGSNLRIRQRFIETGLWPNTTSTMRSTMTAKTWSTTSKFSSVDRKPFPDRLIFMNNVIATFLRAPQRVRVIIDRLLSNAVSLGRPCIVGVHIRTGRGIVADLEDLKEPDRLDYEEPVRSNGTASEWLKCARIASESACPIGEAMIYVASDDANMRTAFVDALGSGMMSNFGVGVGGVAKHTVHHRVGDAEDPNDKGLDTMVDWWLLRTMSQAMVITPASTFSTVAALPLIINKPNVVHHLDPAQGCVVSRDGLDWTQPNSPFFPFS